VTPLCSCCAETRARDLQVRVDRAAGARAPKRRERSGPSALAAERLPSHRSSVGRDRWPTQVAAHERGRRLPRSRSRVASRSRSRRCLRPAGSAQLGFDTAALRQAARAESASSSLGRVSSDTGASSTACAHLFPRQRRERNPNRSMALRRSQSSRQASSRASQAAFSMALRRSQSMRAASFSPRTASGVAVAALRAVEPRAAVDVVGAAAACVALAVEVRSWRGLEGLVEALTGGAVNNGRRARGPTRRG